MSTLLKDGGKFYLITCDKDYSISNDKVLRSEQFVSAEIIKDFGDGAVEVKTVRDLVGGKQSIMYDIFRPIEKVRKAAKISGLKLFAEKTLMSPTRVPVPMMYVLEFHKE